MERNPKLPKALVEKMATEDFAEANKAGRLSTAKELGEIEDKIFQRINLRVKYGNNRQTV